MKSDTLVVSYLSVPSLGALLDYHFLADKTEKLLDLLGSNVNELRDMPVIQTDETSVTLSWSTDRYRFDIDVFESGLSWFFRDRKWNKAYGTNDGQLLSEPSDEMYDCLRLIADDI